MKPRLSLRFIYLKQTKKRLNSLWKRTNMWESHCLWVTWINWQLCVHSMPWVQQSETDGCLCTSNVMQRTSDQGAVPLRKLSPFCLRVLAKPNTRSIADSSNPEAQDVTSPVYGFPCWLQTPVTKHLANTGLFTVRAMFAFDLTLGPHELKALNGQVKLLLIL